MTADFFYARRDGVSGATTLALALGCALVVTWSMRAQHVVPAPVKKPLTITLTALTDPTPPVQAQPPQPRHQLQPPPPRPAARTQSTPRPTPVRAVPTATSTPTVAATAAVPVAAPAPAPVSTPQNETAPPQKITPPVAAQPLPKGNADHSYEAKLLSLVEAHKLYPTGRQAMLDHPQGTVQVCVSLTRNGEPGDVRIASSSGSMLLDLAARKLVSGLTYPAFPEQAFAGQARHEFCMNVEYQSPDE
ncbi:MULTISPECIES: TonB family protein [unclassified Paraburkholderia]|uniref:TonB family protein n=1 Tax=unclassified Paraburkholderia TaxID=2615204 RepID=UPI002AB2426C|nr:MULTISPECIES: TonB family protein [unclassified Paraburkholderia]